MAKGQNFERTVCRQISQWWSGDENCDDLFWRASNSGGRATIRGRKGKTTAGHYGDIAATDNRGRLLLKYLALEVKRGYKNATVHGLLDRGPSTAKPVYLTWIEQAEASRNLSGAFGYALIHKRDRCETCIYLPGYVVKHLGFKVTNLDVWGPGVQVWYGPTQRLIGMPLTQFFDSVSPDDIRRAYKKWKGTK